jgi:hypothetical protein
MGGMMSKIHHHFNNGDHIKIPCDPDRLRKTAYKINTIDGYFDCKKCKKALERSLWQAVIIEYKEFLQCALKRYKEKV